MPRHPASAHSLANTRQAHYQLLRQRSSLQQILHESTHTLARLFLEVDANRKAVEAARRLRAAARERLAAQETFHERGRITPDRLLDAVDQHADAIGQEAQFLAEYNASIASLEEAKGTLLAFEGSRSAQAGRPTRKVFRAKDPGIAPATLRESRPARGPGRPHHVHLQAPGEARRDQDVGDRTGDQPGPNAPARRRGPMRATGHAGAITTPGEGPEAHVQSFGLQLPLVPGFLPGVGS